MIREIRPYVLQEVELTMTNGQSLHCEVFLLYPEGTVQDSPAAQPLRVADILNDDRLFLPILDAGGRTRLLNKSGIAEVRLIGQDEAHMGQRRGGERLSFD